MTEAFRILFADDEETFLYSTADLLRREGYRCDCAFDATAARTLLQESPYDLVIADLKMPGNADLEFVRQLSDISEALPVILVTGHPSISSAIQSVELPVVAYLVKPFDFSELLAKVQAAEHNARVQRVVRAELARLQDYRQGLMDIEACMRHQPRGANAQSLQAFVGVTARNVVDGLASLHSLLEFADSPDTGSREWPQFVPSEFREVLRDAVATLERTKSAFKSKELGELRKKLEGLLKA